MPDATPNPIQPLEGKTSIDREMFFEPELLSYEAARRVADEIARKVSEKIMADPATPTNIVLTDGALLADLANLEVVYLQLDGLKQDYAALAGSNQIAEAVLPGADAIVAPAALTALNGGLNAALGLLSLFREDTEFHGRRTQVDATAFQLMLAGALKNKHAEAVQVTLPRLLAPRAASNKEGSLRARLIAVHEERQKVWVRVRPLILDLARLDTDLDIAARAGNQPEVDRLSQELMALRRVLDPITDPLSRLDARLNELETQWQRLDEKTGLAPLARLLRAEVVHDLNPLYVYAGVVSAGGSFRIRRSLWRTLFCGDGLSFSGGVIVMWALLNSDGTIRASGVERDLLPFRRFNQAMALDEDYSIPPPRFSLKELFLLPSRRNLKEGDNQL